MTALWIVFAVTFPYLTAAYITERLPVAWLADPGGWRLPKAQVAALGAVFAGLGFVGLIDVAVNL
jgi:hypothetical protein